MARQLASLIAVLALALLACARADAPATTTTTATAPPASAPEPPAVIDALFGAERVTVPLSELPARVALAPGEGFKIVELGRDDNSSHHVVGLRDREPLHRHDRHDLVVVTLEGHGRMLLGDEERVIGPRSIVYVPRGVPHSMRNGASTPLYGYAVFTPAFDGKDRVAVEP